MRATLIYRYLTGPDTAESFSKTVGKVEGLLKSYSRSFTSGESTTHGRSESTSWQDFKSSRSSSTSTSKTTSSSTTYGESFQLTVRDGILPSQLTNLPYADPVSDRIEGYAFNPEVGAFHFQTPFIAHFRDLPEPLVPSMPLRPDSDQILTPWKREDVSRLKLKATPQLIKAIETTWKQIGGPK